MSTKAKNLTFWGLLSVIIAGYLLQSFTPLRLSPDALIYLLIANHAAHGGDFTANGMLSPFASGYPVVIWVLAKAGIATSLSLNLLNLLGIGAGMAAVLRLASMRGLATPFRRAILLCGLLSFPLVKDSAIPLSDPLCFGCSLWALVLAEMAIRRTEAASLWFGALSLAALAFWLRIAGVAIFGAILLHCLRASFSSQRVHLWTNMTVATGMSGFAAWNFHDYFSRPHARYEDVIRDAPSMPFADVLRWHLRELGEFVLNLPQSKLPGSLQWVSPVAGIAVALGIVCLVWRSHRNPSPTIVFIGLHAAMVFAFPRYGEARIWMPVLPLLIIEAATRIADMKRSDSRWINGAVVLAACFLSLGLLALGYSDWLAVSPKAFVNAPMNADYRREYEVWLLHRPVADGIDQRVVQVLNEFGRQH